MNRHHRSSDFFRLRGWIVAFASTLPVSVFAQGAPRHDMGSMPGMTMDAPGKPAEAQPKRIKKGASSKPNAATGPSAPASAAMAGMGHDAIMPATDHSPIQGMGTTPEAGMGDMPGMATSPGMDMGAMMKSMQGGSAPADARDPDVYADGLENGHMAGMDMADDTTHVRVMLDRLEQFHGKDGNGQAVDAQAWVGGDLDKLWLKVDGERSNGRLGATRTEALWNHAIAPYWGLQAGVRHDFGGGPGRSWASFGFQGLSPYWFDIQATGYVGEGGRTALRFEGEYDVLLTQRLILQPDVKVSLYGKSDPDREIGSGLSDIDAGLRLRYEISRKFAPYIGVVWNRKFAHTAHYARDAGNSVQETRVVAGLRIWF